jgi:hypothetical protein
MLLPLAVPQLHFQPGLLLPLALRPAAQQLHQQKPLLKAPPCSKLEAQSKRQLCRRNKTASTT